jgi:hypothetical protein
MCCLRAAALDLVVRAEIFLGRAFAFAAMMDSLQKIAGMGCLSLSEQPFQAKGGLCLPIAWV